jgi:hypothetical protein
MNKKLKSLVILSALSTQATFNLSLADGPQSRAVSASTSTTQTASLGSEYAGPERTQAAIGHYARARTLLVEAMKEFEAGREIARPDLILNAETWKAGVSARADELGHIISPQARETSGGARFRESHATLNQNFDKPKKFSAVKAASVRPVKKIKKAEQYLVSAETKDKNFGRARLNEDAETIIKEEKKATTSKVITEPLNPVAPRVKEVVEAPAKINEEKEKDLSDLLSAGQDDSKKPAAEIAAEPEQGNLTEEPLSKTSVEKQMEKAAPSEEDSTASAPVEESETAKSINDDEIRARLKKLSEEIAQEEKNKK